MRLRMIAAVAATVLAAPAFAAAEEAGAYKIGFVNVERVMRSSRATQQAQKDLEAEFQKRNREVERAPQAERERRGRAVTEDMTLRRDDSLKQFVDRTNGIIRRIAEAEKFDAVFFEAAYVNGRIDLTDRVIKELDSAR